MKMPPAILDTMCGCPDGILADDRPRTDIVAPAHSEVNLSGGEIGKCVDVSLAYVIGAIVTGGQGHRDRTGVTFIDQLPGKTIRRLAGDPAWFTRRRRKGSGRLTVHLNRFDTEWRCASFPASSRFPGKEAGHPGHQNQRQSETRRLAGCRSGNSQFSRQAEWGYSRQYRQNENGYLTPGKLIWRPLRLGLKPRLMTWRPWRAVGVAILNFHNWWRV